MSPSRSTPFSVEIDADALIEGGAESGDVELAVRIVKIANELQAAMDAAARAGLILKPDFQRHPGSATDYGSGGDSFVCKVEIYRKLI